jgi:hypothetical protein
MVCGRSGQSSDLDIHGNICVQENEVGFPQILGISGFLSAVYNNDYDDDLMTETPLHFDDENDNMGFN